MSDNVFSLRVVRGDRVDVLGRGSRGRRGETPGPVSRHRGGQAPLEAAVSSAEWTNTRATPTSHRKVKAMTVGFFAATSSAVTRYWCSGATRAATARPAGRRRR